MTTTSTTTNTGQTRSKTTGRVAKVVELIGKSDESWEAAAQVAIEEARKTIHGIHGVKIKDMTARIDPETGRIVEYRTCIDLSFGIIDEER
jgi:flavin-binding protein dodecin